MKQLSIFLICLFFPVLSGAQSLQWNATQGPYSTIVNSFDTSGGAIYAGTNIGLFRSLNSGSLWLPVPGVPKIVSDITSKDGKIFAGGAGGFTVSLDGGSSWIVRDSGFPLFIYVYALKNLNGTLYACLGGDGLYRTKDEGIYWEHVNSGGIENKSVTTMVAMGNVLIAAEGAGIIRSSDNGFSWRESGGDIANQPVHTFAVKDNKILAGTDAGVFISTDSGATWISSRAGMHSDDIVSSLLVSSDNKTFFAGATNFNSGVGIYRSSDDGTSWQLVNSGLTDLSIYSLFSIGTQLFAGTSLGISSSTDNGNSWTTSSTGLPKPSIVSLTSFNGKVFAGSKGAYVFSTYDKGNHWENSKKGFTRPNVNALLGVGTMLFAGTDAIPKQGKGGIHRSIDGGASWKQLNNGVPIMSVLAIALYKETGILISGDSGVFHSTDNGDSWKLFSNSISNSIFTDSGIVYVASNHTIFTYDDNAGWTPLNIGIKNPIIQAVIKKGSNLFIATDSGIYRSVNGTIGSQLVTGDSLNVESLWSNELIVVAGTKTGIYVSSDNGSSWLFQQSADAVSVNTFTSANRNLYAGTNAGVISAPLTQFGENFARPENSSLLQVSKSSNDRVTIRYSISQRTDATLILYDILGNECLSIFQGKRDPGEYTLELNTSLLPSKTYILCLTTKGGHTLSKVNIIH